MSAVVSFERSPSLSFLRANEVSDILDCLIEKINEAIRCNFSLRGYLIEDLSSLNKDKLITWISSPTKKFQNLNEDTKFHFAIPDAVGHVFERVKTAIQQASVSVMDREKYYEDCMFLIKKKSENINPPIEDYSWMSLKTAPSGIFKEAIDLLLSQPEVQALHSNVLEQKVRQLFQSMEEMSTTQILSNQLASIFELSRDQAMDIAYRLEKGNPFYHSLTDILLANPHDLIDRNLCFLEHGRIHAIKIEKVHIEEFSQAAQVFALFGKSQKVLLTVDRSLQRLTSVGWQTEREDNLASFIRRIDAPDVRVCEVGQPLDGAQEDWGNWLPVGEYTVESFSQGEQGAHQNVGPESSKGDKSLFWKMLEVVTTFATERKKYFKKLHFIPTSNSPIKTSETISFELFLDEHSKETHFTFRRGIESKECPIHFDWFCRFFPVKIKETIHVDLSSHQQKDIYITQTDLFTNESLIEKLKQRSAAEKAIIDHLKKIDLNPILESLMTDWACQENFLRKSGKVLLSLRSLFCVQELKDLVFTICEMDNISLNGSDEFNLLLDYVFRANLEQMAPNLDLSEGSDLIKMLENSLKLSETLKGKRGVAILGETGSGKSATTCFLIGAEMEEYVNRFGKTCVRAAGSIGSGVSQLPEIGFSLGISQTTFTQGFGLINLQEAVKIGRKAAPNPTVHFPMHIDQHQFLIVDFPGFYDTRGTEYEVITNFSVDHGILSLHALDAIIQVIPYDLLTSRRSVFFIHALRELSTRFRGAFRDPVLSERIFFLITKQDLGVGVEQLRERALELIHEEKTSPSPDLDKCELLTFFVKQCQKERVFAITPMARLQRIDILNQIIKTAQKPDEENGLKEHYQLSLDSPEMKIKFTDVLNRSIGIWMDTVLPQFLNDSKSNIQEMETKIHEMETTRERFVKETNQRSLEIDVLNQENTRCQQMIETLRQKEIQWDQISAELIQEIQEGRRGYCARIEEDIRQLRQSEKHFFDETIQLQSSLQSKVQEANRVHAEIRLKNQTITKLTTGFSRQDLHEDTYSKKSKVLVWLYRSDIDLSAKRRRAIDRGTDRLSDYRDEYERVEHDITDRFVAQEIANIHKDYQLLPPGQDQTNVASLNQLIAGHKSIVLDRGNYRIEVVTNKVRFDYIRHHNDGKQVCYGYILEFDGKPPYPSLIITHVIPNAELNRSEVMRLKQEKAALEGREEVFQRTISRLRSEVADVQERLAAVQSLLMEKEGLLGAELAAGREQVDAILTRLNNQIKQNKKKKKRVELAIKNHEALVKKFETDLAEWSERLEKQLFRRKRWALFIRTHASHLENAIKMAEFLISLKTTRSGIDAIDAKEMSIVKEAQVFLDFYQNQKDSLEKELSNLGLTARAQKA